MSVLILIRGLPGSGKSTLAKQLCGSMEWFEADHYFIDKTTGSYMFDATKLSAAHRWCLEKTKEAMQSGGAVVSNTFTTKKELLPYFELAKSMGVIPVVYHCQNQFGSIHNVPEETMDRMRARWESDISELFLLS